MSGRTRLALCAFAATMLAAASLLPLVGTAKWFLQAVFLLALQTGVGVLARRMRLARVLTVSLQLLVTLLTLTVSFAREYALFGVVPGPQAVQRLGELLTMGADDVDRYAIPAPATDGIRLMLIGGVLLIGLTVDVLAVTVPRRGAGRSAAARAVLGGGRSLRRRGGLALVPARGVRLSAAPAGRGPGPAVPVGAGVRRRVPYVGRSGGRPGGVAGARVASVRTGRRIGVVALGIALVVPAALPALDGGLLGGTGGGSGRGSGGGTISAVNPLVSLQNNLNQPENREVMSYRTNADEPAGLLSAHPGPRPVQRRRVASVDPPAEGRPGQAAAAGRPGRGRLGHRGQDEHLGVPLVPADVSAAPLPGERGGHPGPLAVRARGAHPRRRRRPDDARRAVRGQQSGGGADGRAARRGDGAAFGPGP